MKKYLQNIADKGNTQRAHATQLIIHTKKLKISKRCEQIITKGTWKANSTYKMLNITIIGETQIKPKWKTTTYLLEWLKLKRLTIPSDIQDVEQLRISYIASKNVKWYSHFGKVWQLTLQLQCDPAFPNPRYIYQEKWKPMSTQKQIMFTALHSCLSKAGHRASLVAQWLGICLPTQGTRVRALVWEDPTCRGAARPVSHNYWAWASGACAPQQERPR